MVLLSSFCAIQDSQPKMTDFHKNNSDGFLELYKPNCTLRDISCNRNIPGQNFCNDYLHDSNPQIIEFKEIITKGPPSCRELAQCSSNISKPTITQDSLLLPKFKEQLVFDYRSQAHSETYHFSNCCVETDRLPFHDKTQDLASLTAKFNEQTIFDCRSQVYTGHQSYTVRNHFSNGCSEIIRTPAHNKTQDVVLPFKEQTIFDCPTQTYTDANHFSSAFSETCRMPIRDKTDSHHSLSPRKEIVFKNTSTFKNLLTEHTDSSSDASEEGINVKSFNLLLHNHRKIPTESIAKFVQTPHQPKQKPNGFARSISLQENMSLMAKSEKPSKIARGTSNPNRDLLGVSEDNCTKEVFLRETNGKLKIIPFGKIQCQANWESSSVNARCFMPTQSSSFPRNLNTNYGILSAGEQQYLRAHSKFTFDTFSSATGNTGYSGNNCKDIAILASDFSDILPHSRSYHRQYLQRSVSPEPEDQAFKYVPEPALPSNSEAESEYVILDRSYEPPGRSPFCWVGESVVLPPETTTANTTPIASVNGSTVQGDSTHFTVTKGENINPDFLINSLNPVSNNSSINKVKINPQLSDTTKIVVKRKNSGGLRAVAETIGSVFSARTSATVPKISGNPGHVSSFGVGSCSGVSIINSYRCEEGRVLSRSRSLPDLQNAANEDDVMKRNYSDDEDGDDFGFLSYPISFMPSFTSTAMNKAKSPSPANRIIPKRWRSKSKPVPAVSTSVGMWTPGLPGSCAWSSVSGRKVQLRPVSILNLTDAERMTLQKVALSKLQTMDIGCPVVIPNENSDLRRAKKSSLSLKRRSKSVSAPIQDSTLKDGKASGLVFGIPLSKCLINDREREKRRRRAAAPGVGSPTFMKMRRDSSDNIQTLRANRKSSSSFQASIENSCMDSQHLELTPSHKRAASSDSLSGSESSRNTSSSFIDAMALPTSNPASRLSSSAMDGNLPADNGEAQVPYIVRACFRHIETYGLQTLGIFRVGSSKKRVKQLREEFDSGKDVLLTEENNPHDVGALLKEYFRDLPDPLLTRELYLPFLHAERMKDVHQKHCALSLLISMLPVASRDTLWALLQFLATVSQHATDRMDERGKMLAGNKMDAHNLATLFGPNILHRTKAASDRELMSESVERVEQSKEVIEVVKDMIDNHHELFEISGSLRDDVLRLLVESDQEMADRILRHIANQNQIETDPESMCSVFEDSANSPMLYHSMNSDADLLAYAHRQTVSSHRPLRITKSADDSLDSPPPKSRVPILSESQALSPTSRDNHKAAPFTHIPSVQYPYDTRCTYPSPVPNRVPVLKVCPDSPNLLVHQGRSLLPSSDYPHMGEFNQSLNIPRPLYIRENSISTRGSGLSVNGLGRSENDPSGQWILPTPPTSRAPSPKPAFHPASSSSTLIASPGQEHADDTENTPPINSAEWERERWKHWEKIAAKKKSLEIDQETLV